MNDREKLATDEMVSAGWDETRRHGWSISGSQVRAILDAALRSAPQREAREMVPEISFDPTNHHNALKCPYCNPKGLILALPPSPEDRTEGRVVREACDWPTGMFTFIDEPGAHDPCHVVMPGGAMLSLNHHAGEGVDISRAKFMIAACNAALNGPLPFSPAQIQVIVTEAMQDCWNDICSDTDCHPLDIKQLGRRRLEFHVGHWARQTGARVAAALSPPERDAVVEDGK